MTPLLPARAPVRPAESFTALEFWLHAWVPKTMGKPSSKLQTFNKMGHSGRTDTEMCGLQRCVQVRTSWKWQAGLLPRWSLLRGSFLRGRWGGGKRGGSTGMNSVSACTERARKSIHISRQIKREPKQRAFTDVRPTCCQTNRGLGEAVCSIYSRYSPLSTCPTSGHKMCYMLCVQAMCTSTCCSPSPAANPTALSWAAGPHLSVLGRARERSARRMVWMAAEMWWIHSSASALWK